MHMHTSPRVMVLLWEETGKVEVDGVERGLADGQVPSRKKQGWRREGRQLQKEPAECKGTVVTCFGQGKPGQDNKATCLRPRGFHSKVSESVVKYHAWRQRGVDRPALRVEDRSSPGLLFHSCPAEESLPLSQGASQLPM